MNDKNELLILDKNTLQKRKQLRYKELENRGITEPERSRAVEAEFVDYITPTDVEPWPGDITGVDLAGNINLDLIISSKEPPIIQPNTDMTEPFPTVPSNNPYPNNPTPDINSDGIKSYTYDITHYPATQSSNWVGTANVINSEPPSVGVEGFNSYKSIPEWRYPIEQSQMMNIDIPPISIYPSGMFNETILQDEKKSLFKKLTSTIELIAEFVLSPSHTGKDVCDDYAGKTFDLMNTSNRPILPIENKGYTELVHPHCHCTWKIIKKPKALDTLTRKQQTEFDDIKSHITKSAKNHTLHTVKADGSLSKRTRGTNPIRESIGKIRHQVKWLSDEYIQRAKEAARNSGGVLYLIRAASETITNHMSEGEKYRRKLTGKELNSMARTAVGSGMDVNHNPLYKTGALIVDSEYDDIRKEIQMLVIETDPQINQYIANGSISDVSINGGGPRSQGIEPCDDECVDDSCELCNVPKGVILGQMDGIGLTFVVTTPQGIMYKGDHIAQAKAGISNTVIEIL